MTTKQTDRTSIAGRIDRPSQVHPISVNARLTARHYGVLEHLAAKHDTNASGALRTAIEYARVLLIIEARECSLDDALALAAADLEYFAPHGIGEHEQ